MKPITLYGGAFSLYTGRARSYLIKSRIDYREERSDFYELLMALQAFDREVTAWDVTKLLSGIYK